jgi:hypothetical protein
MTIETDAYEASRGHRPRGTGLWMFALKLKGSGEWVQITFGGTYTEASKYAMRLARTWHGGSDRIQVCP